MYILGLHREAKRRDAGPGDRGVGLGLHPPNRHHRQHDARRAGGEVGPAEHRGPDHDHQRDESGGASPQHLPEHHQGGTPFAVISLGASPDGYGGSHSFSHCFFFRKNIYKHSIFIDIILFQYIYI